jgi:hypothetical protein
MPFLRMFVQSESVVHAMPTRPSIFVDGAIHCLPVSSATYPDIHTHLLSMQTLFDVRVRHDSVDEQNSPIAGSVIPSVTEDAPGYK